MAVLNQRYRAPAATAVAAAVLTAILIFTPLRFTYRSPELRVALEAAQAVIAGLVALLLYGRHRRSGLWTDFLAAYALALSSASSVFFALLPALAQPLPGAALDRFEVWAPLLARMIGTAALAWAALTPRRWMRWHPRPALTMLGSLGATLAVIGLAVSIAVDWLPPVIEDRLSPERSGRPDLDAPWPVLAAQLALVVLSALAAVGFSRRSEHEHNPLVTALACGSVLFAFSRLNFFLYPSIYTDVVHVGDLLRLAFYLALLAGAAGEIAGYWRIEAEGAAAQERQRLDRELHDGLAQELAFIRSHTAAMARGASPPGVTPLVAEAAERAIAESRRVVEALRSNGATSLEQVLVDAAGDVARWAGTRVEVALDDIAWLPAAAHAELRDLVRRVTTDAVRLRGASTVSIRLGQREGRAVLAVQDDGSAVDAPGADGAAGRDLLRRAEAVGATVRIAPADGGGTVLQFVLPWRRGRGVKRPREET